MVGKPFTREHARELLIDTIVRDYFTKNEEYFKAPYSKVKETKWAKQQVAKALSGTRDPMLKSTLDFIYETYKAELNARDAWEERYGKLKWLKRLDEGEDGRDLAVWVIKVIRNITKKLEEARKAKAKPQPKPKPKPVRKPRPEPGRGSASVDARGAIGARREPPPRPEPRTEPVRIRINNRPA